MHFNKALSCTGAYCEHANSQATFTVAACASRMAACTATLSERVLIAHWLHVHNTLHTYPCNGRLVGTSVFLPNRSTSTWIRWTLSGKLVQWATQISSRRQKGIPSGPACKLKIDAIRPQSLGSCTLSWHAGKTAYRCVHSCCNRSVMPFIQRSAMLVKV